MVDGGSASSVGRAQAPTVVQLLQRLRVFDRNVTATALIMRKYHVTKTKKGVPIDSFYSFSTSVAGLQPLLLFKITTSLTRPIDGDSLIHLLERLEMLTAAKANPTLIKLIFVVPNGIEAQFQRQDIVFETADDEARVLILQGEGNKPDDRTASKKMLDSIPQFVWGPMLDPFYTTPL